LGPVEVLLELLLLLVQVQRGLVEFLHLRLHYLRRLADLHILSLLLRLEYVVFLLLLLVGESADRSHASVALFDDQGLALELLDPAHQLLADLQDGCQVGELSAVVGGGEEGEQLLLVAELVAVLDDLVGAADEVEFVLIEEEVDDVLAVVVADSSLEVVAPPVGAGLRIRPEDIRDDSASIGFHWPFDAVDRCDILDEGTESPVYAEDAVGDDCGDGEEVEGIGDDLPCLEIDPSLAFVVEPVELVEFAGLVVTPEEEEVVGVLDLVGHQQADALQRLLSPVHVVSQEQVVPFFGCTKKFEDGE
jgi:hypothetical protein